MFHIQTVVPHLILRFVHVLAPLAQAFHFERRVQVCVALGLNDYYTVFGQFDDEVWVVVRGIAVPVNIIKLEIDRKVVFGVGNNIRRFFQNAGKFQLKMAVADYAVEHGFLGAQGFLFRNHEWPRIAQLYIIANFGVAFVPDCQRVYGFFETFDYRLS